MGSLDETSRCFQPMISAYLQSPDFLKRVYFISACYSEAGREEGGGEGRERSFGALLIKTDCNIGIFVAKRLMGNEQYDGVEKITSAAH